MATLLGIQRYYKYELQDLDSQLEKINDPATNDVRDAAIAAAINAYSRRLPRVRVALQTVVASGFYPLPSDWQEYSEIVSVESPIDQLPPAILPEQAVSFIAKETGSFYVIDPNPSASFRVSYTTVHGGGSDNVASIPASHEPMIALLAASEAAMMFAARYANTVKANADAVEYRTKEQEWHSVSKKKAEQADAMLRRVEWAWINSLDQNNRYRKGWRS